MPTKTLSAKLPPREFAIAAWQAGMVDATKAEILSYSLLRLAGKTHEQAKALIIARRDTAQFSEDTGDTQMSVRVPVEWLSQAIRKHPDMSPATLFRYSLMRLTEADDRAMERAIRKRGPKAA
jgi:hypothetical protein